MICRYCNTDIEQDARFCPNCGKDLSLFNKCVKCGELLDRDTVFCPYCEAKQPQEEVEETPKSKKWLWIIGTILLIGVLAGGGYYLIRNTNTLSSSANTHETGSVEGIDESRSIDIRSVEGIKNRLNEIFSKALSMQDDKVVETFFSEEFIKLYEKVDEIDAKLDGPGFWNGNMWDGGQDGDPNKFEIIGVSVSPSSSLAHADVNCKHQSEEYQSEHRINLVLVLENDIWVIDNIDGNKEQMKEYLISSSIDSPPKAISEGNYSMAGKVSNYGIHMTIEISNNNVKGYYYYDSQGSGNTVQLKGTIDKNGYLKLFKLSAKGEETGFFEGTFEGTTYSGKNVNYDRDESLPFSVSVGSDN